MRYFLNKNFPLHILIVCLFFSINAIAIADTQMANPATSATNVELKIPTLKGETVTGTGDKVSLTLENLAIHVKENKDIKTASPIAKVTSIESGLKKAKDEAGIGDEITFTVENLDVLVNKAKDSNKKIILFINNIAIKGVEPLSIDITSGKVVFVLTRTDESKDAWAILLGNRKLDEFSKIVPASIGIDNEAIASTVKFNLILIRKWSFWIWLFASSVLVTLIAYMGKKYPLLKATDDNSPYSLGKTQMAIWTCVVIISYLFIWIVIRDFNSVNETALILLGISIATGLGASLVDSSKASGRNQLIAQKDSLQTIINDLQTKISSLPPTAGDQMIKLQQDLNNKIMQKAILEQKIAAYPLVSGIGTTNKFFEDILQDADGWSLHRVQMFLWTIILVGIFFSNVFSQLSMPEFSTTLLALMGISSGTYIGFKFPERS